MASIAQPNGHDSDHDNGRSQQAHDINGQAPHGQQPKVIIIGAGCAGCALGQGLKKASILYTIYEARDYSKNPGRVWSIGLHWAAPGLKSLLSDHYWARLPAKHVGPNYRTGEDDEIPIFNGCTGEIRRRHKDGPPLPHPPPALALPASVGFDIREVKSLTGLTNSPDG